MYMKFDSKFTNYDHFPNNINQSIFIIPSLISTQTISQTVLDQTQKNAN